MSSSLNSIPPPTPPPSPSSYSYNTSLLVIAILLAFVVVFTILIHLILRLLARLSSTPTPSLIHLNSTNSSILTSTSTNTSTTTTTSDLDPNRKSLINSLPQYSLSSLALSPSANCTICLSHFTSEDKLRLLPPCRHVFHSHCIDVWLKSSPSCPLCRSLVQVMHSDPPPPQPQQQEGSGTGMGTAVEEAARVSWLKEYMERLAISASSSFNSMRYSTSPFGSMRFSTWGNSRRYDDGEVSGSLELGESFRSSEESGYFASSYKWMMNLEGSSINVELV